MIIKTKLDWLFEANRQDALAKTARANVDVHQLDRVVRAMPELVEKWNKDNMEIEVRD